MFSLPTTINIDGVEYKIRNKGDFRMVLDCFSALDDAELDEQYRVYTCLIIFYDGMTSMDDVVNTFGEKNIEQAVLEMFNFFNCGQVENSVGATSRHKLVDWSKDSQLIASAINSVARMEVRALDYLHWWTFMGYYLSIGDSPFSTIVGIRDKIKKGKKLEDYEKEFRRNNPNYFIWDSKSVEDKQIEDEIMKLWHSGGV